MIIESNIAEVLAKLQAKNREIQQKSAELRHRLADIGEDAARGGFAAAAYPGTNDVRVTQEDREEETVVAATGRAAPFIEFGTGIRNAPYPGELPPEMGPHGTYGEGGGANPKGWIYKGEPGTGGLAYPVTGRRGGVRSGVHRTYGNPPAAAMLQASNDMSQMVEQTAREVFG